jgi:flagellar biosynthesis protein FlhB
MAGERTEQATQHRREKARKDATFCIAASSRPRQELWPA